MPDASDGPFTNTLFVAAAPYGLGEGKNRGHRREVRVQVRSMWESLLAVDGSRRAEIHDGKSAAPRFSLLGAFRTL